METKVERPAARTAETSLGGSLAGPVSTQRGSSGGAAEHAAGGSSVAGSERQRPPEGEGPEARMARYRALVDGEFKDLFTADTQRIIDRRFKETRGLREALEAQRPVLERLMDRYGVARGDLPGLAAAVEAEDARRDREAAELARLLEETARQAAQERERALVQNILARGVRPPENGGGAGNGLTTRLDPGRMTPAQREEIARRAAKGERITFS